MEKKICAFDDFASMGKSTVSNFVVNMLLRSLISVSLRANFDAKSRKNTRLVKISEKPKNAFWTSLLKNVPDGRK